jgi:hypothetical protein
VTPVARTLLDVATAAPLRDVRRAIAQADYRNLITPAELEAVMGRGVSGSATLRAALAS